jgi:uncharacterized glyoxalase superfamily metalloenzyme YdcJ
MPFRVFCSLLRPDDERFFDDIELRRRLHTALARRDIFSPRLRELIAAARAQGGLDRAQADAFLAEGERFFRWHGAARDRALYDELLARKLTISADICCFPNPHLNHLTPNSLDIDDLQARMQAILAASYRHLGAEMKDDLEALGRERLAYFVYEVTAKGARSSAGERPQDLDALVAQGHLSVRPIRYEDFLPVSAAGIFASNLRQAGARHAGESPHKQQDLERIMQRPILDSFAFYAAQEAGPLAKVQAALGVSLA